MPHIHKLYDYVVSVFIVHRQRVLLVFHKKYNEWLPIGGHVDLNEDPDQALYKEIREECGLKVKILANKPPVAHKGVKPLLTPSYMDVHRIKGVHKHIAFVYFGRANSDKVKLHEREHREFRWLNRQQLDDPQYRLTKSIHFYCREALEACEKSQF